MFIFLACLCFATIGFLFLYAYSRVVGWKDTLKIFGFILGATIMVMLGIYFLSIA